MVCIVFAQVLFEPARTPPLHLLRVGVRRAPGGAGGRGEGGGGEGAMNHARYRARKLA